MLCDALIHPLVPAAYQNKALKLRETSHIRLCIRFPFGRKKNGSGFLFWIKRPGMLNRPCQRLGLEKHSRSSAIRSIINRFVLIKGKITELMRINRNLFVFLGPLENGSRKIRRKSLWKK